MIRVHVKTGILGTAERITNHVPHTGQTAGDLVAAVRDRLPPGTAIAVAINGQRVEGAELGREIPDGADVVIGPDLHGPVTIGALLTYALVSAAVSFAVNYVVSLIVGKPKAPGVPQERGDERSPTYAWDGVSTNYGQGFPVPFGYGRHDLGGQGVFSSVMASTLTGTLTERLLLILALCEGRIHRVGDQTGGTFGEANALGGFPPFGGGPNIPDHIRVNGTLLDSTAAVPGARVWFRAGELAQSPPPTPFDGTNTVFAINSQMNAAGQSDVFLFTSTAEISSCQFTVAFPGGLFQQLSGGQLFNYPVQFTTEWRPQGQTAWQNFLTLNGNTATGFTVGGSIVHVTAVVETVPLLFPQGTTGPVEVRLTRTTASGGPNVSDQGIWRQVGIGTPHVFAYPRTAWLGLELEASERLQGGLPRVQVRCDLARVRVWDASINGGNPSSARYWDLPAAGDPYAGLWTYPPGRNPAWILADFLTSPWGLGEWLDDTNIDWPAFRRWAAFCDTNPGTAGDLWDEARFACDFVGDAPRPAWEIVMLICAAGRATPVMRGDKVSVVYQYRDEHSDGSVTVPAKAPLQLFTSGNVEDLSVVWLPKANRPTVILYQFLNEEQDYAQDVFPLEDFEAAIGDPTILNPDAYRPEDEQAYGVTRRSQLYREGIFTHRVRRLVEREVTFRTGPWALAIEPGDLFELEHDVLRPFSSDVPLAMSVLVGGTAVTQITVDHAVSLPGAGTLEVVVRDPDGAPDRADVSAVNPVTGGTELTLSTSVTVNAGAPCSVGIKDKITETYECVAVNLTQTLKREVRGIQWVPSIYDEIPASDFTDTSSGFLDQPEGGGTEIGGDLRLVLRPSGTFLLSWTKPPARRRARSRVFMRVEDVGTWFLVTETRDETAAVPATPLVSYQVFVSIESVAGGFAIPVEDSATVLQAPEFPEVTPAKITNARSQRYGSGMLYEWDPLEAMDLAYYEIRVGRYWNSAETIYRGHATHFFDRFPRAKPDGLFVAARSTSGLYSHELTAIPLLDWDPTNETEIEAQVAEKNELNGDTPGGTHSGTEYVASIGLGNGVIRLTSSNKTGTYTGEVVDAGFQAPFLWVVAYDMQELDDTETVDDLTFELGSGEAHWRTIDGRASSRARPGVDWETTVDDLAFPIDDVPDYLRVQGHAGDVGSRTSILVESRFYVDAAWGSYQPHENRVVVAERMQVRISLRRESFDVKAQVPELVATCYI